MYRVQKYLSILGVASRRECERKIKLGAVRINDVIAELGSNVNIGDVILYDDQKYFVTEKNQVIETKIIMYHKPIHEIVSRDDPQKRPSVFESLPDIKGKWINIGRLDFNTSGLILFTNDGDLANKMMHPSSNIIRAYEVKIRGSLDNKKIQSSLEGIDIGNSEIGRFKEIIPINIRDNKYLVKLNTGKNREIRRIFSHLGCYVINLKRTSYGQINLGQLKIKCHEFIDNERVSEFIDTY